MRKVAGLLNNLAVLARNAIRAFLVAMRPSQVGRRQEAIPNAGIVPPDIRVDAGAAAVDPALLALKEAAKFRGIYTRVARRLGLSAQHVREVALGHRRSARVKLELDREFKKILNGGRLK